eukprot:1913571-Pleurochrysis_carterae.AAC.1
MNGVNASVLEEQRAVALPQVQPLARGGDNRHRGEGGRGHGEREARGVHGGRGVRLQVLPPATRRLLATVLRVVGADGRAGIVVDRRLGFGGAYAPNRFERISTLVAAAVQAAQARFNAASTDRRQRPGGGRSGAGG